MDEELYWDGSYAIARRLMREHPDVDWASVTLSMIYNWVVALPEFKDDPQLANDELLTAIYQDWYEADPQNRLRPDRPDTLLPPD